jgi:hypothetical protein
MLHIALAAARSFNAYSKGHLLHIRIKPQGKAPYMSRGPEHLIQFLLGDRAMLLKMEKDATNSWILEAVLPCVNSHRGDRSFVASLACASDIKVRVPVQLVKTSWLR